MHNFRGKSGLSYNYNPDFSGSVIVIDEASVDFHIPGRELLQFVASCYIIPERIALLEGMSWETALTPRRELT